MKQTTNDVTASRNGHSPLRRTQRTAGFRAIESTLALRLGPDCPCSLFGRFNHYCSFRRTEFPRLARTGPAFQIGCEAFSSHRVVLQKKPSWRASFEDLLRYRAELRLQEFGASVSFGRSDGRKRVILTNIKDVAAIARARGDEAIAAAAGPLGFFTQCFKADLVIIDNDHWRVYIASALRPLLSFALISIDLILRRPTRLRERLLAKFKALALSQVDKFIFYFKDIAGYHRHYGVKTERAVYVPFKPNGRDEVFWPTSVPEGEYVLCAGRTMRDIGTFVEAMEIADCPAVLLQQPAEIMRQHGTDDWRRALPSNVKLVIHKDGKLETFLSFIAKAKLVVIPRYEHDIGCTGISTYLMAMALGKCVVISRGPGVDDLLGDEAAIVPPQDTKALAVTISRLWNDDIERWKIATCGKKYADSLGDTARLCGDILAQSLFCLEGSETFQPAKKAKSGCVDVA